MERVLIKVGAHAAACFPVLKELFPEAHMVFNTRNAAETIASFANIVDGLPRITKTIDYWTGAVREFAIYTNSRG